MGTQCQEQVATALRGHRHPGRARHAEPGNHRDVGQHRGRHGRHVHEGHRGIAPEGNEHLRHEPGLQGEARRHQQQSQHFRAAQIVPIEQEQDNRLLHRRHEQGRAVSDEGGQAHGMMQNAPRPGRIADAYQAGDVGQVGHQQGVHHPVDDDGKPLNHFIHGGMGHPGEGGNKHRVKALVEEVHHLVQIQGRTEPDALFIGRPIGHGTARLPQSEP